MSDYLLKVRNLMKYYPVTSGIVRHIVGYVQALESVNFDLKQGEVIGIVGETGCGKTTLGRTILKLIEPTAGEIIFNGQNILKSNSQELRKFRREAQIVFQNPLASLNPRKTILDAIGEGPLFHGIVSSRHQEKEHVVEILNLVGFGSDVLYRYPHQFSGGQQQRLCIARAIALNPRFIVCDEAVSALDVSIQAQILNLLQDLKKRFFLSYLFISHDLSTIRYLSNQLMVLYLGKVMEKGPVEAIFREPKHPYTQALLSAIPKNHPQEKKQRLSLSGEIPSSLHPPSGCPFRTRCPYAQPICAQPPPKRIIKSSANEEDNHEYYCILD